MKIVVIGGSGHIGTYLVPRLVRAGHEVVNLSRGQRSSYTEDEAWLQVRQLTADRTAEDADGTFPARVAGLRPDVVIDLSCLTLDSAAALVEALRGEHPGHIVGPGWPPVGPLGNTSPEVGRRLSAGDPVDIPGIGAELLHHVHADDVAQGFERAVAQRDQAAGEDFNVVAPSKTRSWNRPAG
jgi:nucleoside-diphosphate-sugar epimerase